MFEKLIERLCERAVFRVPYKVIPRPDGGPYLVRFFLLGGSRADLENADGISSGRKMRLLPRWFPYNVFLHCFLSGDEEEELHSHPWDDSLSFILTGGYWEERRVGDEVISYLRKPFTFNRIRSTDYHRVDLLKSKCWTLFIAGKNTDTWYFWDRRTKEKIPWREQIYVRNPRRETAQA